MRAWLIATLALPIAIAGCGSDDDGSGGASGTGGSAGQGGSAGTGGQAGSGGTGGSSGSAGSGGSGASAGQGGSAGSSLTFTPPEFSEDQLTTDPDQTGRYPFATATDTGYVVGWAQSPLSDTSDHVTALAGLDSSGQTQWNTTVSDIAPIHCSIANAGDKIAFACRGANGLDMMMVDEQGNPGSQIEISSISDVGMNNVDQSSIAWSGSEFGVTWRAQDASGLVDPNYKYAFFARMDESGSMIGSPIAVDDVHQASQPTMIWTGTEYAVAYVGGDSASVYLRRIDADGKAVGDPRAVSSKGYAAMPSLAWNGEHFGVTWTDDRDHNINDSDVFFRRIDDQGMPVGSEVTLTTDGGCHSPSLVWTGEVFALVWSWQDTESHDQPSMHFASIDGDTLLGQDKLLENWSHGPQPTLLWAHDTYALAWQQPPDPFHGEEEPQIFFSVSP